jgi:hypothetical protein
LYYASILYQRYNPTITAPSQPKAEVLFDGGSDFSDERQNLRRYCCSKVDQSRRVS